MRKWHEGKEHERSEEEEVSEEIGGGEKEGE